MPRSWYRDLIHADEEELLQLRRRLEPGALDHLGVLERARERTATRERIAELEERLRRDVQALGALRERLARERSDVPVIRPGDRCVLCRTSVLTIEDRSAVCRQCRLAGRVEVR